MTSFGERMSVLVLKIRFPSFKILILVLASIETIDVLSQDLASIGKNKPLTMTGGVALNNILYAGSGRSNGRDPFMYVASANVTFDLYGWSIPLSFTYSNQRGQFQQPFNQYGLSPTYKWITAHLGYRSMSFSPYTLNGHIFFGSGLELTPGKKFKVSAMYGRLQKAVTPDSINNRPPMYERYGTGFKVAYANDGNTFSVQLFKAWDKMNSFMVTPDSLNVFPMENLVVGISGGTTLYRRFVLGIDAASSALTRDIRATEAGKANVMGTFPFLYQARTSSSYYKAIKSTLSYKAALFTVTLGHERVDPGYQTLGAYYFNNDLENLTLGVTTNLWQKRINLSVNGGSQKNNLDNTKINTMRRVLTSANAGVTLNSQTNLNVSYSNFQSYTAVNRQFQLINQLTVYDNLDTLNFIQINQSANAGLSFTPEGNRNNRQLFSTTLSYQGSDDKQNGGNSRTSFYSGNVMYNYSVVATGAGITLSLNGNYTESAGTNSILAGPTVTLNRSFLEKKLKSSFSSSYSVSYANKMLLKKILNFRINNSYTVNNHNFSLSIVLLDQNSKGPNGGAAREMTSMIGYNYTFNTTK